MPDKRSQTPPIGRPEPETPRRTTLETEQLAEQMSVLLTELVRTPEVMLSEGWTPGLAAGQRLGRFVLRRPLGRGGFGVVWEAEDPDLQRPVAVKVVKTGSSLGSRGAEWMRREAEAVARLNHPNIVTLHDFGTCEAGPYLVFELLSGQSLDARLEERGPGLRRGASRRHPRGPGAGPRPRQRRHPPRSRSPATSSSPPAAGSRCSTSAWPTSSAGPGRARAARRPSWRRSSTAASRATRGPTCSPSAPWSTPCSRRALSPTRRSPVGAR